MPLKSWFLEVACCPGCSGEIVMKEVKEKKNGDCVRGTVVCGKCRAEYPVVDGIPILHSKRGKRRREPK